MQIEKRYRVKANEVRSTGAPVTANFKTRRDTFAHDILREIGRNEIIVKATRFHTGIEGLTEYEIVYKDNEKQRVSSNEERFNHLWCILTNREFCSYFEPVEKDASETNGDDSWGVWTSMPDGKSSYHGGLTKQRAINLAKSQCRNGSDEVKVVIMQPFAVPVMHININTI